MNDKTDTHAAQLAAVTAEALDWRAQVGELSDRLRDVRAERDRLATEWANASQANYQRAKKAEAENAALRAQLATARADALREAAEVTPVTEMCEGWCLENGGKGKFNDCQTCRIYSAILALIDTPPAQPEAVTVEQAVQQLFNEAVLEAEKAMRKFPQPNYVISKVAEEAGEVVKAAIHCAEGRETAENVIGEIRQAMAMLIRLYVEGDQVHGLPALRAIAGDTP